MVLDKKLSIMFLWKYKKCGWELKYDKFTKHVYIKIKIKVNLYQKISKFSQAT